MSYSSKILLLANLKVSPVNPASLVALVLPDNPAPVVPVKVQLPSVVNPLEPE